MRKSKSELMARLSADWFHRGLISRALSQRLAERYGRHDAFLNIAGRWLGIFAILLIASGAMALAGISSGSPATAGSLMFLCAGAAWGAGVMATRSKTRPMPVTGATLVTLSFVFLFAAGLALMIETRSDPTGLVTALLFICAALSAATAYCFSLRWPLFLAVLFLFHGIGSWGAYAGGGAYGFSIQHPPGMALIAAFVTLLGLAHRQLETRELSRCSGFGQIMIVFGLLYLDCSLWFLSLGWEWRAEEIRVVWTLVFAVATLSEIVLGAFLKDALFTGYGVVFLAINLYTQFFERFWDKLPLALFLTIAGLTGIIIGFCFETLHRRQKTASSGEAAP